MILPCTKLASYQHADPFLSFLTTLELIYKRFLSPWSQNFTFGGICWEYFLWVFLFLHIHLVGGRRSPCMWPSFLAANSRKVLGDHKPEVSMCTGHSPSRSSRGESSLPLLPVWVLQSSTSLSSRHITPVSAISTVSLNNVGLLSGYLPLDLGPSEIAYCSTFPDSKLN